MSSMVKVPKNLERWQQKAERSRSREMTMTAGKCTTRTREMKSQVQHVLTLAVSSGGLEDVKAAERIVRALMACSLDDAMMLFTLFCMI